MNTLIFDQFTDLKSWMLLSCRVLQRVIEKTWGSNKK